MITLKQKLKEIILTYYQGEIPSSSPRFYTTKQWLRSIQKKVEAEANDSILKNLKKVLSEKFPMFSYKNGLTSLVDDSCYSLDVLLHKGIAYDKDERDLIVIVGGPLRYMNIFISALGPFCYFHIIEMSCVNKERDKYDFKNVKNFNKEENQIMQTVRSYMGKNGYTELSKYNGREKLDRF